MPRTLRLAATIALVAVLAACAPAEPTPTTPPAPSPGRSLHTAPAPVDPIDALTLEQRVAQLFVVGTPADAVDPTTLAAVQAGQVGGVFLAGRSSAGAAATGGLVAQFTAAVPAGSSPLWVATDQEGGDVQVLSGEGFSAIPTALTQAATIGDLRAAAAQWGSELRTAGVMVDLAPVADIVTSPDAANPPIGDLNRQYGFDEQSVAAGAGAVAAGLRDAGVLPTFKHFPGLGRVTTNTDYAAQVIDDQVGADSPDVAVYRDLLAQGPALVMMSSATYTRLDGSVPALFSAPIVTDLLRSELGFRGVVMTDDVSAADAVAAWAPGDRAVMAITAGVDVVLVSADPSVFAEMYQAVLSRAQADPAFADLVDAAARRVLRAKAG